MTTEFRIYVASLSDYNNGILHGVWIDIDAGTTADEIQEQINDMLNGSPAAKKYGDIAEEWAVHDYEGFKGIGEYPDLETLCTWVEQVEEHGEAWRVYVENVGTNYATVEDFQNTYRGEYGCKDDFVYEFVDEMGYLANVPDTVRNYFDYDAFGYDLLMSDFTGIEGEDGKFYVFWNY